MGRQTGSNFRQMFDVPPRGILEQAVCTPLVAEWFWPIGEGDPPAPDTRRAQRICSRCPVIRECGQYALDNNITDGVWGGMRPDQLRRLVHGRGQSAIPREVLC